MTNKQDEIDDMRDMVVQSLQNPSYFISEMVGLEVYDYNKDYVNDLRQFLLYRSGRKAGKCFELGSTIYTEDGVKRVESIKDGDRLLSSTAKVGRIFRDNGYEVKLNNGLKVTVNAEHKFYTQRGWVKAINLSTDDRVECSSAAKYEFNVKPLKNAEIAKLLGYLCSDGMMQKNRAMKFSNNDEKLIEDVEGIVARNFTDLRTYRKSKGNGWDLFIVGAKVCGNTALKKLILDLGISNKDTLGDLQLLPINQLKAFLQGYANGNGYIGILGGYNDRVNVVIGCGMHELISKQLQFMFWRLGVNTLTYRQNGCMLKISRKSEQVKLLGILNTSTYPDKFSRAYQVLHSYDVKETDGYASVKSVIAVGEKEFIELESVETHELISLCGMRTHNTASTAMKVVWYAYFAPYVIDKVDTECNILIVAPAQHQAQIMMDWIKKIIKGSKLLEANVIKERQEEIHLEFIDGKGITRIMTRAAGTKGKSLRGYEPDVLIIDEASWVSKDVLTALLPSGMTGARLIMTSSPFGRQGGFYDRCKISKAGNELAKKDGYDNPDGRWVQYYVPSTLNKKIQANEIYMEEMKTMTDDEYRTEVLGEFLAVGDALFPQHLLQEAFGDYVMPTKFKLYMGVDVARKGKDDTVITVIAVDPKDKVYVTYCKGIGNTTLTEVSAKVAEVYDMFSKVGDGIQRIWYDTTGLGAGAYDISQDDGLPVAECDFSLQHKAKVYLNLVRLFEHKQIKIGINEKLMYQLSYIRREYTRQYLTPESEESDDFPDSLGVACMAVMSDEEFELYRGADGKPMDMDELFN